MLDAGYERRFDQSDRSKSALFPRKHVFSGFHPCLFCIRPLFFIIRTLFFDFHPCFFVTMRFFTAGKVPTSTMSGFGSFQGGATGFLRNPGPEYSVGLFGSQTCLLVFSVYQPLQPCAKAQGTGIDRDVYVRRGFFRDTLMHCAQYRQVLLKGSAQSVRHQF